MALPGIMPASFFVRSSAGGAPEEPLTIGMATETNTAFARSLAGEDFYSLYPNFDKSLMPWHTGTAPWDGSDEYVFQEAALPVTTRQVSVDTWLEFQTEAAVAQSEITVTASISGLVNVTADDIDIIINPGVVIDTMIIEGQARIRVRGPTPGSFSGGQLGQLRSQFSGNADWVIDGISMNGDGEVFGGGQESNSCFRVGEAGAVLQRMAVLNCRCIAGGYFWGGNVAHVLFAGTSAYHGAASAAETGYSEGWGIRNHGGPVAIYECDIRGTRYVNVRTHSEDSAGEYLYIGDTTLVATAEGRTAWFWPNLGNNTGLGSGAIIEDCDVYAYSVGGACTAVGPEFSTFQCKKSRGSRNNLFGAGTVVWTQAYLDSLEAGGAGPTEEGPTADPPGVHSWGADELNTFDTYSADPAWGVNGRGAGDPTGIAMPEGLTLITGSGDCTGGP